MALEICFISLHILLGSISSLPDSTEKGGGKPKVDIELSTGYNWNSTFFVLGHLSEDWSGYFYSPIRPYNAEANFQGFGLPARLKVGGNKSYFLGKAVIRRDYVKTSVDDTTGIDSRSDQNAWLINLGIGGGIKFRNNRFNVLYYIYNFRKKIFLYNESTYRNEHFNIQLETLQLEYERIVWKDFSVVLSLNIAPRGFYYKHVRKSFGMVGIAAFYNLALPMKKNKSS